MLVIPYAQLFVATNDERLFVIGFPAAVVMAVTGTAYLMQRLHITYVPFLVLALCFFAMNLIDPNAHYVSAPLQVIALVLSLAFLAVWVRRLSSHPM